MSRLALGHLSTVSQSHLTHMMRQPSPPCFTARSSLAVGNHLSILAVSGLYTATVRACAASTAARNSWSSTSGSGRPQR